MSSQVDKETVSPEGSRGPPLATLAWTVALSLAAQLALLGSGFLSAAADDSARVIRAIGAPVLGSLIEPDVWPPFDKVIYSVALTVGSDPVWAPRIVTSVFGLAVSVLLVWLTWELYENRPAALLVATLAPFAPFRLIFSVSTMGEIFLYATVVAGLVFVVRWLKRREYSQLLVGCLLLAISTTTRYEAWFMAVALAVAILYWWSRGLLRAGQAIIGWTLLAAFPTVWLSANLASSEPIEYLSITSQQAAINAPSMAASVSYSAGTRFAWEALLAPILLLGVWRAVRWVLESDWRRDWILLTFTPIVAVTIATISTGSVPKAAPWRLGGLWVLTCLPIAAGVAVDWWESGSKRRVAVAIMGLLTLMSWLAKDVRLAHATELTWDEVHLARSLAEQGPILLEVSESGGGFDYLDLIASAPDSSNVEMSIGDDPFLVALFSENLDEWEARRPDLIARYAAVNFDLADADQMRTVDCQFRRVAVNTGPAREALTEAGFQVVTEQAGWTVYRPDPLVCDGTDG